MNTIWIDNSYFREEIRVSLDEAYPIIFVEMKKASKRNLHLLNVTCQWMKAIIFRVFDDFANSPTNYRFFDTVSYQKGRKLLAWCLYFNTWTLCFYKERSVFQHVLASCLRNVYCLNLAFDPRRKKLWYLRLYLTQIIQSNGKMLFAWRKNCLSKFLLCAAHV